MKIRNSLNFLKKTDICQNKMFCLNIKSYHEKNIKKYNSYIFFLHNFFFEKNKIKILNKSCTKSMITLLKSPHVFKKARRQLGLITYEKNINYILKKNLNLYNNFLIQVLSNDWGCLSKLKLKI